MKIWARFLLGVTPWLAISALLSAQAGPTATGAWVAAPAGDAAEVYAVVENPSMYEIFVVKVSAEGAGAAEIVDGPSDAPKPVRELAVPAYGRTELKAGEMRIRLRDLTAPLKAGDAVALTLTTDGGGIIKVMAQVK